MTTFLFCVVSLAIWHLLQVLLVLGVKEERVIKLRGVKEMTLHAFVALPLEISMVNAFVDEPFMTCMWFVMSLVVPLPLIWERAQPDFARLVKLYRKHDRKISKLLQYKVSPPVVEEGNTKSAENAMPAWQKVLKKFADKNVDDPKFNRRFHTLNRTSLVVLVITCALLHPFGDEKLEKVPESYNQCFTPGTYLIFVPFFLCLAWNFVVFFLLCGLFLELFQHVKKHKDSIGIRSSLVRLGLAYALSLGLFSIFFLLLLAGVASERVVFSISLPFVFLSSLEQGFILPILALLGRRRDKRLKRKLRIDSMYNSGKMQTKDFTIHLLQRFVLSDAGYKALFDHLKAEFCLELLHFIVQVVEFTNRSLPSSCGSSGTSSQAEVDLQVNARKIYARFIQEGAEEEINIPGYMRSKLEFLQEKSYPSGSKAQVHPGSAQAQEGPLVSRHMFNEILEEVLSLLYHELFQRFLETPANNQLWKQFCKEELEADAWAEE